MPLSGELRCRLERKSGISGSYSALVMLETNVSTYTHVSGSTGNAYHDRILAYHANGESPYANEAGP